MFSLDFTGIILLLVLGMRHGLDPDHLAMIDALTLRFNETKPALAKWVGTLFAFGHGLVVIIIAAFVSSLSKKINFPETILKIAEWIPTLLLLLVGILNLNGLIKKQSNGELGWRSALVPKKLKNSSNPLSIILIGVLFATVFDTATQAAAWGYASASKGGIAEALLIGVIFSFGMIAMDTIDSRILFNILKKRKNKSLISTSRIYIGWTIVIMSFSVAGYKIISSFIPQAELSSNANSLIGLAFLIFIILIYFNVLFKNTKSTIKNGH